MLAHAGASGPGSSVGGADAVQQHLAADKLRKVEEELKEVAAEVKRADVELVQATSAAKANHKLVQHLEKRFDHLVACLNDIRQDLIAKSPNSAGGCCKRLSS
jgi:predicted nuclease with TOPRIM domain